MAPEDRDLQDLVRQSAERLNIPGAAVGIFADGVEHYAVHGVTHIEHPLPVDEHTLIQIGSTGKTFTASAIMRLVDEGKIDLLAPVRTYVPELRLQDEDVAARVNVLNLLNHTAGWDGDFFEDTGAGDDALARYVELMADLDQISPLGSIPSYNNAAVCLAGRVIETVTERPYELAVKELLLDPLGLEHTMFFPNEVMTRRFTAGHEEDDDGSLRVYRPWAEPRSASPAGGSIASCVRDQVAWARVHLGTPRDGAASLVLSQDLVDRMQEPTVDAGGAVGDFIGISWILRDVDGVRLVEHGGSGAGHESTFTMVPDRGFAVTVLANGPGGTELGNDVGRWSLENYLGVIERDPVPVSRPAQELDQYAGSYETIAVSMEVAVAEGHLRLTAKVRPEIRDRMTAQGEEPPPDPPPFTLAFLEGDPDRFVVPDGPLKGERGYFIRNDSGAVDRIHFGGRLANRSA